MQQYPSQHEEISSKIDALGDIGSQVIELLDKLAMYDAYTGTTDTGELEAIIDSLNEHSDKPPLSEVEKIQSLMIISYVKSIIDNQPDIDKDKLWDRVFKQQIEDIKQAIKNESNEIDISEISLSLLVCNIFASHGKSKEEKRDLYINRMWEIAQSGIGKTIYDSANKNVGFCVLDKDYNPEQGHFAEYESVISQIGSFGRLLTITDMSASEEDNYLAPIALETGNKEQIEWYFKLILERNQIDLAKKSMKYVNASIKKEIVYFIDELGIPAGNFVISKINSNEQVLTPEELVDLLIKKQQFNSIPVYIEYIKPDKLEQIITDLIEYPSVVREIIDSISYDDNFKNSLSFNLIKELTKLGIEPNFELLSTIDSESIIWLLDNYTKSLFMVLRLIKGTSAQLQETVLSNLLSYKPPKVEDILYNFNCFNLLDNIYVVKRIIAEGGTLSFAAYMNMFKDKFDKEFIELLIDNAKAEYEIIGIIDQALRLPDCDIDWLYKYLIGSNNHYSLLKNLEAFMDFLSEAQIKGIVKKSIESNNLFIDKNDILKLKNSNKISIDWVAEILIKYNRHDLIIENYEFFNSCVNLEHIVKFAKIRDYNLRLIIQKNILSKQALIELSKEFYNTENYAMYFIIIDSIGLIDQSVKGWELIDMAFTDILVMDSFMNSKIGPELIKQYGINDFISRLIYEGYSYTLYNLYDIADDIDQQKSIFNELITIKASYGIINIIKNNINNLPFELEEIIEMLKANNMHNVIFENFNLLFDKRVDNDNDFAWNSKYSIDEIIELGMAPAVIIELYKIAGFGTSGITNQQLLKAINITIDMGYSQYVISNINYISQNLTGITLNNDISEKLIKDGYVDVLIKYQDLFGAPTEYLVELAIKYECKNALNYYYEYKKNNPPIEWLDYALSIFDNDTPLAVIAVVKNIYGSEPLPQYLIELGVTYSKNKGIDQLKQVVARVRSVLTEILIEGEIDTSKLLLIRDNPIAKAYAKSLIKFTESEWGEKDDDAWVNIINGALDLDSTDVALPVGFKSSGDILIPSKDVKELEEIHPSKDTQEQYDKFKQDISYIINTINEQHTDAVTLTRLIASQFVDLLKDYKKQVLDDIEKAIKPEHKIGLNIKLNKINSFLDKIDLNNPVSILQNIYLIDGLKIKINEINIESLKRRLIICSGLQSNNPEIIHNAITIANTGSQRDGIILMNEFIENNIIKELYSATQIPKNSKKSIKTILNLEPFVNYIDRINGVALSGMSSLRFIPARGLMLELSGHYSDACWASRYESITKTYPNISCVTFLKNQGKSSERIVGSCLLLDTIDQATNQRVLVIRGLNPTQNYIMDIDMQKFVSEFMAYVKSIAGDRKVAIVLDNHSGGALTNRPDLYSYLTEIFATDISEPLTLDAKSTTFNGYKLSKNAGCPVYIIN